MLHRWAAGQAGSRQQVRVEMCGCSTFAAAPRDLAVCAVVFRMARARVSGMHPARWRPGWGLLHTSAAARWRGSKTRGGVRLPACQSGHSNGTSTSLARAACCAAPPGGTPCWASGGHTLRQLTWGSAARTAWQPLPGWREAGTGLNCRRAPGCAPRRARPARAASPAPLRLPRCAGCSCTGAVCTPGSRRGAAALKAVRCRSAAVAPIPRPICMPGASACLAHAPLETEHALLGPRCLHHLWDLRSVMKLALKAAHACQLAQRSGRCWG